MPLAARKAMAQSVYRSSEQEQGANHRKFLSWPETVPTGREIERPHGGGARQCGRRHPEATLTHALNCGGAVLDEVLMQGGNKCLADLMLPTSSYGNRRAAEERDEIASPHHSITSSARASSVAGTSRPSAFAVLRLMTSSYLVGACTGKSAGFSPLRMRST